MNVFKIYVALSVLVFSSMMPVAASEDTTVILVSDNYADCSVSEALAEENNATIVKTPWGEFEQSVLDTILEVSPLEVIIIGGPMAVVEEYETKLEDEGISVSRLWGQTRQQTSLQVFNRYMAMYNWSAAVGDGAQPYRMAGRFPVWYFDNESEIDGFMEQHREERRAMVMNYGMVQRFAGRFGTPHINVTSAQVQNFGMQMRERINTKYANQSWIRHRHGMGYGMGQGMGKKGY